MRTTLSPTVYASVASHQMPALYTGGGALYMVGLYDEVQYIMGNGHLGSL